MSLFCFSASVSRVISISCNGAVGSMTGDLVRSRLRTSVPFLVRTAISIIDTLLDHSSGSSADAFATKV